MHLLRTAILLTVVPALAPVQGADLDFKSTTGLDFEIGSGQHSNPSYVTDSLARSSTYLGLLANADWKFELPGIAELRSGAHGDYLFFNGFDRGNTGEARWSEEVRIPFGPDRKRRRNESYVGIEYKLKAVDNAILSSSDRTDPDAGRLGYLENRGTLQVKWNLGTLGRWTAVGKLSRMDFKDLAALLAPLDRTEREGRFEWESGWNPPFSLEAGWGIESLQYLEYPARDRAGDRVDGEKKHYRTWSASVKPGFEWRKWLEVRVGYEFSDRTDTYQGYFDYLAHEGSVSLRLRPTEDLYLRLTASRKREIYDTYRVGYNSTKPLKRIGYDDGGMRLQYTMGRFRFLGLIEYKAEDNNSPGFSYQAISAGAGLAVKI